MRVLLLSDAAAFLEHAGAFLLEREAEHNLLLGLAGRLREEPHAYGDEPPYFAVLERDGEVVGAAQRTPPHNLILSELNDLAALEPLVVEARSACGTLPGVIGPKQAAAEFARLWGGPARILVAERIYRADRAVAPEGVGGGMRPYAAADFEPVVAWLRAFLAEAMPDHPVEYRPVADADQWAFA